MEIAQIENDLAAKRAVLERQKQEGSLPELPHEKETLREVVVERLNPSVPASVQPAPAAPAQPVVLPPPAVEPPSYLSPELKDMVQVLVNDAFTTSIDDAIKKARSTNNPALIDAFHDALVDELYGQLVERGKLKKM